MPVSKYVLPKNNKRKTEKIMWQVQTRYVDYTGELVSKHKRGFETMREAKEWEQHFQAQKGCKIAQMTFEDFVAVYYKDIEVRENTMNTKRYLVDLKILPYFKKRKMIEIGPADIISWQKEIKSKKDYEGTYLRTIQSQLSAIFNHAVTVYQLPSNPCHMIKGMGTSKPSKEMRTWTQEEFETFLPCVSDKMYSKYGFLILFWTGIRLGELLALTKGDFDFERKILSITRSCQYLHGERIITEPKTKAGVREITLPDNLIIEVKEYFSQLYGLMDNDLLFPVTKSYFSNEMRRGAELSGVEKIRIHDLRHSHASLLISKLNLPITAVSRRLGHEKISVTLDMYSHLYGKTQMDEIAQSLDKEMEKGVNEIAW